MYLATGVLVPPHTHTHIESSCRGLLADTEKMEELQRAEMSWNCRFIPETPKAHRDSIHHICISICTLTSHTHSTLNKLHSEWKHAACWSLMCLHCVHTPTSHIHHVELAVCLAFRFFFFPQVIIMVKAQQHNSTLYYIVPSRLTHFSFLIAVGF